jgi:PAS domain S-box-containing protein
MLNQYKAAFEESSEPKLIVDYKCFKIIDSNSAARKVFPLSRDSNETANTTELVPPKNKQELLTLLKKAKVKKSSVIGPIQFLTKKNKTGLYTLEITQLKIDDKKLLECKFVKENDTKKEFTATDLYNHLFDSSKNPFIITDDKFRLVYCNKASELLFRKKATHIIGKKLEDIYSIVPDSSSRKEIREGLTKNDFWEGDVIISNNDDAPKRIRLSISKISGNNGKSFGTMGIFKNISDIKNSGEELKKSETIYPTLYKENKTNGFFDGSAVQINPNRTLAGFDDHTERINAANEFIKDQLKYKSLFESANDAIILMDGEKFIDCNEKTLEMFECKKEDIINKSPADFSPEVQPDGRGSTEKALQVIEVVSSGKPQSFEWKLKKLNGSVFDAEVNVNIVELGDKFIHQAILRDITERKISQQQISMLAHALKSIQESVCITDMLQKIIFVNDSFCSTYDYGRDELIGKHVSIIESKKNSKQLLRQILPATLKGGWTGELINVKSSGEEFPVSLSTSIIRDDEGKPVALIGVLTDISERKKAEKTLQTAEQKFREIVEHSSDIFYSHTPDGVFTYVSPQSRYFLGCEPEEAMTNWADFATDHPINEEAYKHTQRAIVTGKPQKSFEVQIKTKDGRIIWAEISEAPVVNDGKTVAIIGAAKDITERKRVEETLLMKNYAVASSINAIGITDLKGILIYVNDAAVNMWGYKSPDEILGRSLPEFWEGDGIYQTIEALENEGFRFGEDTGKRKDGSIFSMQFSASMVKDNDGNPKYMFGSFIDITERKKTEEKLRESEQRFRSLIYNMLEAALILDLTGKILFANISAAKLVGFKFPEQAIGKKVFDFLHLDYIAPVLHILAKARKKNTPLIDEYKILTADGKEKWVESLGSRIEYDGNLSILVTLREITNRKNSENQLREAKEKAEEMSNIKSNFLANMSHELRTPLVGILGFAEMLTDELKDENLKEMSDKILDSGRRLMETLNSLLDLSRIEANRVDLTFTSKNISELVTDQTDLFRVLAERKNLYLNTEILADNVYVSVDEQVCRQILNNLINNALKYTYSGGVTISVDSTILDEKEYARVVVEDTGIGIPEDSLSTIFQEFRQVSEGFNRHFEGTGLGLTITKKFVGLMDGSISVESEVDKGSMFTLVFPTIKPSVETEIKEYDKPVEIEEKTNDIISINRPKILVVENDDASKEVTKLFLKNLCEMDFADSGEVAISLVNTNFYEIILMDINLGIGMNGIDTTKEIRKISSYENTPIVALTAFAMRGDREEFLKAGCTHYMSKPFTKEKIVKLVSGIFKQNKK